MMLFKRFLNFAVILAMTFSFAACGGDHGGDPDEPNGSDNGEVIKPDEDVPDPVGTISLAMRDASSGDTYLGNIHIKNENFRGSGVKFTSMGAVKGLGNVSYIPKNGWTDEIRVTPGEGYVAYDSYQDKYYRIYVVDYITSTAGGIIGADVKYQEPFKGVDEEIELAETALSFGEDGGSQALFFDNSRVVLFDIESDAPWCSAVKATNLNEPFLYNGVVITVEKTVMDGATANVTLTTPFGKTKVIKVTYAGHKVFTTVGDMSVLEDIPCEGGTFRVGVASNCVESLVCQSSEYWLSAYLENGSEQMRRKAASLTFVGGKPLTRGESVNDANDVHTLVITAAPNERGASREALVTVESLAGRNEYRATQLGNLYIRNDYGQQSCTFAANPGTGNHHQFTFTTSYPEDEIEYETDFKGREPWFDVQYSWGISSNIGVGEIYVFDVSVNTSEDVRTAEIIVRSKDGANSLVYTVTQEGAVYSVSVDGLYNSAYYVDKNEATYSLKVAGSAPDLSFISSAPDWITATYTAGNVVLRIKGSDKDRTATIKCNVGKGTFVVHQSKYAVGDNYSEKGIDGSIFKMENGVGYILKKLSGKYEWSKENIVTGCGKDGKANMEIIRSFPDWQNLYPAFAAVDALNVNGVTGWYLPGEGLLDKHVTYWTSTEYDSHRARCFSISYNGFIYEQKSTDMPVIAVHEFMW